MKNINVLTVFTLLLASVNANAEWVNYSCYKNASQKGEETDKVFAYNE